MFTVVCHFYNEEYLLPWWLEHHRKIFDHGIMIDYHSTDRSCELIREYCPSWSIVKTRNPYFESSTIDQEVMDYERDLQGWRVALNVPEFLYGNVGQLNHTELDQVFVGNYVFIDPAMGAEPLPNQPLHTQASWGHYQAGDGCHTLNLSSRCSRSIHRKPVKYTPGRHWGGKSATFDDLAIFYYGYAFLNSQVLERKLQIRSKMDPEELRKVGNHHPNTLNQHQFLTNINIFHRPRCRDLTQEIQRIAGYNYE